VKVTATVSERTEQVSPRLLEDPAETRLLEFAKEEMLGHLAGNPDIFSHLLRWAVLWCSLRDCPQLAELALQVHRVPKPARLANSVLRWLTLLRSLDAALLQKLLSAIQAPGCSLAGLCFAGDLMLACFESLDGLSAQLECVTIGVMLACSRIPLQSSPQT
jgi:hypothetical protein